jgi:excisionase family DNA binding protein
MSAGLLDLNAVAQRLGLTVKGVRGLVTRGELPAYRIASRIRVDPADLDAFVAARRIDVRVPQRFTPARPRPSAPRGRLAATFAELEHGP